MSTPEPAAPPPKSNAKKWLLGCLGALLLLVLLGIAVLVLGVYAAKKQIDAMAPDAKRLYEDAQRAADAMKSAEKVAPTTSEAAEARMRLMRAAATVASTTDPQPDPCGPDPERSNLSVDAQWMAALVDGLPTQAIGTPWFRHQVFASAASMALDANDSEDDRMQAQIALDRALIEAGSVAVIHTTRLVEPRLREGGKVEGGEFEGFVQLVGYPDGETMCISPFTASGTDQGDFEARFWTAEEAALGK
jgi:hypothetical protein